MEHAALDSVPVAVYVLIEVAPRNNTLPMPEEETIMNRKEIELLDTVALVEDLPARSLHRGEVGTVVEILDQDVYEVEFCDNDGQTYAELALAGASLIVLHNQGKAFILPSAA
jgi:hypothetical protein